MATNVFNDVRQQLETGSSTKDGTPSTKVAGNKPYQLTPFEIDRPPFAYTLNEAIKVHASPAPTLTKPPEPASPLDELLELDEVVLFG